MHYQKKKFLSLAISFYLMGISGYVVAEELETLEEKKSGDVVISATRTEQEVKETPAAVQVITREEIDKLGAKNLSEALKLATSVNIGAPAMAGRSVSVRGMDTRHVLILIDGKRMVSEGSYTTVNTYELERINMGNVERIEIVRGPVSSLYGSEGMAGVINVITRKPEKEEVTLSFSPWRFGNQWKAGTDNFFFRYDSGKKDKFGWTASYGHDNIHAHENEDANTTRNQYGHRDTYDFQGVYDLPGNKYLDFTAQYQQDRLKTRGSGTSTLSLYNNERQHYSIGFRGSNDKTNYEVRTYYGIQDKDGPVYDSAGALNEVNSDISKRKSWVLEGHVSTQQGNNHLLTIGGEYKKENYWGTRVGDANSPLTDIGEGHFKPAGDFNINSTAFYIQDEWLVNNRLLIIPSVRYDGSSKFSDNYSPKIGSTYNLNDNFRLKANIGKGFKAPTLDDMFMYFTHTPVDTPAMAMIVNVTGNPNLKPEKSTSYELAIEGEKGNSFGKLTYFINDVKDLIYTESKQSVQIINGKRYVTYDSTYTNLDKANIDGLEFEIGRHLDNNFTLEFSHIYLDATGTIGGEKKQRLTGRAKHRSTLQLHYDDNRENGISAVFWTEWNNNYLSSITDDDGNYKKKNYNLWNLAFNKKWNHGLSGFIGVDNIFNKEDPDLNLYGIMYKLGVTFKL